MNVHDRVGETSEILPHAARVFEILGIDYCRHRERSLRDAFAAAGVDADEASELLRPGSTLPSSEPPADLRKASLREITAFVVQNHHRRARHMLVNLTLLAAEAASGHEQIRPLEEWIARIAREFVPHMRREEQYLFPYIDSIERERTMSSSRARLKLSGVR
ncbi:MAG TPA: DUF542 domain-containing protein [Thermoanaerobaculia bacterium]|nr:DUF542 domain-containing protein [Thermoanaerobaculia bacterium]